MQLAAIAPAKVGARGRHPLYRWSRRYDARSLSAYCRTAPSAGRARYTGIPLLKTT